MAATAFDAAEASFLGTSPFTLRAHTRGRLNVGPDNTLELVWTLSPSAHFTIASDNLLLREDGSATDLRIVDAGADPVTQSPRVYLESTSGEYLSASDDPGKVLGWAPHRKAWEVWVVEPKTPEVAAAELLRLGFTVLPGVLTGDEIAAMKETLAEAEHGKGNEVQVRVHDLVSLGPQFVKPAVDALICGTLSEVLGSSVRCATWSANTLLPHATRSGLGWHVDYPYHDIDLDKRPPSDVWLGTQVLWLLDDFLDDGSNGGTLFLPESHRDTNKVPSAVEAVWNGGPDTLTAGGTARRLTQASGGTAGAVLIAHSAWWHRQSINKSAAHRRVLLGNYTPSYVVPKDSMERQWREAHDGADPALSEPERARFADLWLGSEHRGSRRGNYH
eukprot:m.220273 g.220273  ORF g.220273 m.220273 type:complete len:389 (-) comp15596_c0_seq2:1941-3107(-)